MRPLLLFADTSVFGGLFDREFEADTRRFFQLVDSGRYTLAVSEQIVQEIAPAPARVKHFFEAMLPNLVYISDSLEVQRLIDSYLKARVVGKKSRTDAAHVAYATVHRCDGLISWNFKHIVHADKCMFFNIINVAQGYPQLFITTPKDVVDYEQN